MLAKWTRVKALEFAGQAFPKATRYAMCGLVVGYYLPIIVAIALLVRKILVKAVQW